MSKFSVTIIGLGNIGMLYDFENNSNNVFLSHFKSFNHHDDFEVVNVVDNDNNKLLKVTEKFGEKIKVFKNIDDIIEITDIVVLSSVFKVNYEIFNKLKTNDKIKLIFIEKPFWNETNIFSEIDLNSNKFYINYFRKSIPFFRKLKVNINDEMFGNVLGVHAYYSKGLKNNGSHIIDLVNYFFGNNCDLNSIKTINGVEDFTKKDKSISFSMKYIHKGNKFPVIFQAVNEKYLSVIEIDLFFEKNRFRICDFGSKVEIYETREDVLFPGYKNMIHSKNVNTDFNKYGLHNCNLINDILNNNEVNNSKLICERDINNIINKVKNEISN